MLDQLERFADRLAPYTELRLHNNHQSMITMVGGTLMANQALSVGGASARSYQDGAFGFASLPSLSNDAIPQVLGQAAANAELLQRRANRGDGDLPELGAGHGVFDHRTGAPALSSQQRVDIVRSIDAYLRSAHPDILNIDVSLSTLGIEKALVNSVGASTYSYVPRTVVMVRLSFQASDGVVEVYDTFGGFGEAQDHLQDVAALHPMLDNLYREVRDKAEGVYCEPGEHDVILDSAMAGILAHEAIGHTCEADIVLGGSIAGDHVGDVVASDKVTLVDFGARGPDGNGSIAIHVDDEGTPCKDVTIIENGVLKAFLHNKETARIMGEEPTGNARAFRFDDEPLVRMRNTAILPGTDKLEDMIGTIDRGYYFRRSTNGQADSTSEFMFGVGCGYEIVDGKLGRAVRDTTVAGVAFDMLKTITHVSDDMTWSKGGMCGKKQMIPVGMGGPAIKCRIGVGGR
ncbi:MAG TPA: TldD/PmbA family protein [Acidimicrobiales bacterium]|nr:TldD/PmbA family protein [Acidimicrobiales bacterium]